MEFLLIKMVIDIKESSKTLLNMVKESKDLQMVIFTKDTSKMINHMDMVNITGKIKVILKVTFRMD